MQPENIRSYIPQKPSKEALNEKLTEEPTIYLSNAQTIKVNAMNHSFQVITFVPSVIQTMYTNEKSLKSEQISIAPFIIAPLYYFEHRSTTPSQ